MQSGVGATGPDLTTACASAAPVGARSRGQVVAEEILRDDHEGVPVAFSFGKPARSCSARRGDAVESRRPCVRVATWRVEHAPHAARTAARRSAADLRHGYRSEVRSGGSRVGLTVKGRAKLSDPTTARAAAVRRARR